MSIFNRRNSNNPQSFAAYDVETLPGHKVSILEDCLYYFLSKKADEKFGKASSLILLPPVERKEDRVEVRIRKTVIRQMWMVRMMPG